MRCYIVAMATAFLDPVFVRMTGDTSGIDPRRLGALLHVTAAEVATLAGLHRSSLTRQPDLTGGAAQAWPGGDDPVAPQPT